MRTTLTLDDDVAAKLKAETRRSACSFRETVNRLLRLALNTRPASKGPPFRVQARPLRRRSGIDLDNVGELLDQLEGSAHR